MLAYPVPPPGPPGPLGTMAWLRATVSRFANGEAHARRRALIEARLRDLHPGALRAAARLETRVPAEYVPVAILAAATGVEEPAKAVAAVRVVAAAYHPGTDAPGADAALAALLELLPPGEEEAVAQHIALLVQACEATAALVRGALTRPLEDVLRDDPPVRTTKRVAPDGRIVQVDLTAHPFGAGPRPCPGRAHALALVQGVVER